MNLPKWLNKKTLAWSSYDLADQAFQALFITLLFPVFLLRVGGNELLVGLIGGGSALAAALLVPFIGATSDATGRRLPVLIYAAGASAALIILVALLTEETGINILAISLTAFLAKVTHTASKDVYDAKIIDVTEPRYYGTVSGLGNTFGYIGTILALLASVPIFMHFGWESLEAMQWVFVLIAGWYLLFLLPILIWVPDRAYQRPEPVGRALRTAREGVLDTVYRLPYFPVLGRFLLASFFYSNALMAIVYFLSLFSQEIVGLTLVEFMPIFGAMSLTAAIGSLTAGRLSDKWGPLKLIQICLGAWAVMFLLLLYQINLPIFIAIGTVGGFFFGAVWTLNRHMITCISSAPEIAKIFGFEGLTSKFSGVIGPILFGAFVPLQVFILRRLEKLIGIDQDAIPFIHDYTLSILSLLLLLLLGWIILRKLE